MDQDCQNLKLENQLCFLIYSTNLALNQLYRKSTFGHYLSPIFSDVSVVGTG